MNSLRSFKQKLSHISRMWDDKQYDKAVHEVEALLKNWPGNAHLHVLWASLVQLQDNPDASLDEVKAALQQAVELDRESPAGAIELGHYLDNVEDDPQAACKAYVEGVALARRLLIDGLIGQAKALRQLGKKEEFQRCLLEVLHLTRFTADGRRGKKTSEPEVLFESPAGHFFAVQITGPYSDQIEELLREGAPKRSA